MDHQASTAGSAGGLRSAILVLVKLLVSGGLLVLLLSRIDSARLWHYAIAASVPWLIAALLLYFVMILASAWRWGLLLRAQGVVVGAGRLVASFLVATFFNNFLPSNIGGDVVRIRDTSAAAGSKTLATTIVLIDRGIGLMGLVLVAALGATFTPGARSDRTLTLLPIALWVALAASFLIAIPALLAPGVVRKVLGPLRVLHAEWVGERIERVTQALARLRGQPGALVGCFAGAVAVQGILVAFYLAIVHAVGLTVGPWHMAVIVPVSFIVQMIPLSVNGFGLREATFAFYFTRVGLPLESALMVSLMGAGLVMFFSLSGAATYVARRA